MSAPSASASLAEPGPDVVPPANTAPPVVSGMPRDGEKLTASSGTWTGTEPLAYAYRWLRCDGAGASCVEIAGATSAAYTLSSGDVAARIAVRVTATNAAGSAAASSDATAAIEPAPPVNITRNALSGTALDGETLTTTDGRWTGTTPMTFAYRWRRCDDLGNRCEVIEGATERTYAVTPADVGATIRARVIATNVAGLAMRSSLQTAVVRAVPPTSTEPPAVSGTARDGHLLSATAGTWSGTPPTYAFQWLRCDDVGSSCVEISGATATSYRLTSADVAARLRFQVIATNAAGSATAISDPTATVAAVPPANITRNAVSGTALDGETLTTTDGRWTGTTPMTFAYRWRRCDALGTRCEVIEGATERTYAVTPADVGATIRARVIATNVAGFAMRSSLQTAVVRAVPPTSTELPAVSGTPRDGGFLEATPGGWTGTPSLSYGYEWLRCDDVGSSCAEIAGATGSSYRLTGADVGARLRVRVTAANAGGTASASSAATPLVSILAVSATAETTPVPWTGDAADDTAIWVHPTSPELSTIIGTNKAATGGLLVYDLSGAELQYLADGKMNNVDLRNAFPLAGESVTLVTAGSRSTKGGTLPNGWIAMYRLEPATRTLVNVAARTISPGVGTYGSCMYRSPLTGKFYYFVVSTLGEVEQWELFDDGTGKVDAAKVRSFSVGSISEGCVADDELGHLYVGEENVGIWKYDAEPDAGSERVLVDSTGPGGHLHADVEGLSIAYGPSGTGYLLASSQGNDSFVVYRREGANAFVRAFKVVDGIGIDGADETDGIEVTSAGLGPSYPHGVFVAHDGFNGAENQNYKLVPLEQVLVGEP